MQRPSHHHPAAVATLAGLFGIFVGGGLFSGWVFFTTLRAVLTGAPPPEPAALLRVADAVPAALGGASSPARQTPAGRVDVVASPTVAATPEPEVPLPVWDGKERVTVLLLGIDQRPDEKAARVPARSDTMILATLDPLSLTGGLLSLPRDIWVPIKGHGENKLNTAHFWGDLDRYGTGPELARQTIQYNFGVPVHYYARVDFDGFVQLVDAVGGVTIDVDRAILDDEYPNEDYGITRLYIPAEPQRMAGRVALKYARSRHADSDFGRIQRQRKVIQAAREEALALGIVPKLPRMLAIVGNAVTTDVPTTTMLALANLARQVPSSAIVSRQIGPDEVIDVNGDGTVLQPDREKIRAIVQEVFYDPVVRKEAARIEVLNGTMRDGLATGARSALAARGFNVVRVDTADRTDARATSVIDRRGTGTAAKLAAALGLAAVDVRSGPPAGNVDITVILGADFRGLR